MHILDIPCLLGDVAGKAQINQKQGAMVSLAHSFPDLFFLKDKVGGAGGADYDIAIRQITQDIIKPYRGPFKERG